MTKNKFKDILSRLERYYSGVAGKAVQIDEWAGKEYYNACFCVFDTDADSFYSKLVANFKFFPRVSEFRDAAEEYRAGKTAYRNTELCYCCMNTGVVSYVKKGIPPFPDYEYDFASRCYCEAGKNRPDWPLCTQVVSKGELDWLVSENVKKYGSVKPEEGTRARECVQRFLKEFASC